MKFLDHDECPWNGIFRDIRNESSSSVMYLANTVIFKDERYWNTFELHIPGKMASQYFNKTTMRASDVNLLLYVYIDISLGGQVGNFYRYLAIGLVSS